VGLLELQLSIDKYILIHNQLFIEFRHVKINVYVMMADFRISSVLPKTAFFGAVIQFHKNSA